jgi:hypothetical protein
MIYVILWGQHVVFPIKIYSLRDIKLWTMYICSVHQGIPEPLSMYLSPSKKYFCCNDNCQHIKVSSSSVIVILYFYQCHNDQEFINKYLFTFLLSSLLNLFCRSHGHNMLEVQHVIYQGTIRGQLYLFHLEASYRGQLATFKRWATD